MIKETLIKYLYRHAGEYQHPVNNCFDLILAYARSAKPAPGYDD